MYLFTNSKIIKPYKLIKEILEFPISEIFGLNLSWFFEFELIYRGSRDGFKAKTFHEKCDN